MPTRKAATSSEAAKSEAAAEAKEEPRTVSYVRNHPYSAGEHPEVVTARVRREYEDDPDQLDLVVETPEGEDVEVAKKARRSDRREPGTWFVEEEA